MQKKTGGVIIYLFMLTGFFMLLELSFFIQCNKSYLVELPQAAGQLHFPIAALPPVLYFLFVQFSLHIVYVFLVAGIASGINRLFQIPPKSQMSLAVTIWVWGIATILVANQYYYPQSAFADLVSLPQLFTQIVLYILISGSVLFAVLAIFSWGFFATLRMTAVNVVSFIVLSAAVILSVAKNLPSVSHDNNFIASSGKPNIIIIGVDALRPDFLSFFGHDKETAFFDSFLNQATVFSEAITPIARTFPSWVSILTGEYPRQDGVRTNLAIPDSAVLANTLPAILKKHDYETIFATDETRFSNIDTSFGFDHVVTPPVGLNDFLLGTFNDFPLSNLLINTCLGKWLFPYSYGNRAAYITYQPNSFLALLQPVLKQSHAKPIFLAVHFCLPHYPYRWADASSKMLDARERYTESVLRADQQVGDFFALLKQDHLLDHAIVVLLSDHGEALALSGDRITSMDAYRGKRPAPTFYPQGEGSEQIDQSAGHGTDVLSLTQYHTVLAFRLFGEKQKATTVAGVVSLLDVKPTVLSLAGFEGPTKGMARIIRQGGKVAAITQHHFMESDFSPQSVRTVYPQVQKVMLDGLALFQIDPKTVHLMVKPDMNKMIIHSKQYADLYDHWLLAFYPQSSGLHTPVLVDLITGDWTTDLNSPLGQHSPALSMKKALKAFYGNELRN